MYNILQVFRHSNVLFFSCFFVLCTQKIHVKCTHLHHTHTKTQVYNIYNILQVYRHSSVLIFFFFFVLYTQKIRLTLWIMQKHSMAGTPEMPLRSWYLSGTKHFCPTVLVGWKRRSQLGSVIKPVPHNLVRRIRFWRIQSLEQDFKYLYWTMSNFLKSIYQEGNINHW